MNDDMMEVVVETVVVSWCAERRGREKRREAVAPPKGEERKKSDRTTPRWGSLRQVGGPAGSSRVLIGRDEEDKTSQADKTGSIFFLPFWDSALCPLSLFPYRAVLHTTTLCICTRWTRWKEEILLGRNCLLFMPVCFLSSRKFILWHDRSDS